LRLCVSHSNCRFRAKTQRHAKTPRPTKLGHA